MDGTIMTNRNKSDHSYARQVRQVEMYFLKQSGFRGKLGPVVALALLLPLVLLFALFFFSVLVAVALLGTGYVWWKVRRMRHRSPSGVAETIELSASEYHSLDEPQRKESAKEAGR